MRLIDADALFGELCDHLEEDEDTESAWVDIEAIVQVLNHAPTVNAIPVEYIEAEIKRMEDEIEHALIEYKHADGTVERMIARKAALEFTLAKWRSEREEE